MKRYVLSLAIILSCFLSTDVEAASLFGKVIEVNSGDVITVFNLNRPVRVKLLGVDAPESNQAFGDVARKHLSYLVLHKSVLVEYSGIAADSSLTGRVLLNDADIGAQMIRDGAAWFDTNTNRLNANDRDIYQHSEQAARTEKRGLWQAENPIAPWEFVKAEVLRQAPVPRLNASAPKERIDRPTPELTNMTLIAAAITRSATAAHAASGRGAGGLEPNIRDNFVRAMSATPKRWLHFRPAGQNFAALVPEAGHRKTIQQPAGADLVDVHSYLVRDGWASYALMWMTGPSIGETDSHAMQTLVQGLLKGVNEGYGKAGGQQQVTCDSMPEKDISMDGFTGTEFDLTSCTLPGRVRAYTRSTGEERQVYVAAVFFLEEEENVSRFLKSFIIVANSRKKAQKTQK